MEIKWWRVRASLDWWYEVIIKGIFIALLPTIIIPAIIVGFLINHFGLTIDSLVAIIFLGQFYIIWAQLEVALRQTRLSTLEYEPEFKLDIKRSINPLVADSEVTEGYAHEASLRNAGQHLARNPHAKINIYREKHIKPEIVSIGDIGDILPGDSLYLYKFEQGVLHNSKVIINISYLNILGERGSVIFIKDRKSVKFIGVEHVIMPGILLTSFEKLLSLRRQ